MLEDYARQEPQTVVDEGERLVLRLFEAMSSGGDLDVLDEIVAADYVNHEASHDRPPGPEGARQTARWLREGFSDLRFDIADLIADSDRVVARLFMRGTHDGPFKDISATGSVVSVQHIHVFRVAHGRIAEHWACRDDVGAMRQLGVLP